MIRWHVLTVIVVAVLAFGGTAVGMALTDSSHPYAAPAPLPNPPCQLGNGCGGLSPEPTPPSSPPCLLDDSCGGLSPGPLPPRGSAPAKPMPVPAPSPSVSLQPDIPPATVVADYFSDINAGNWSAAWALGGDNLYASQSALETAYAGIPTITVTILNASGDNVTAHIVAVGPSVLTSIDKTGVFLVENGVIQQVTYSTAAAG